MGLAGIAIIAWPGIASQVQGYSLGIAYVILAAIGVSVGNVGMKRLAGQVDPIMAMGFQLLIGAVPLALLSILTEDVSLLRWSTEFALILAALSVLGLSLAFWLWFEALERIELNRANAFTFLVPILGLLIGAALFGERLEAVQIAGIVLVLAGILLVQRPRFSRTEIESRHGHRNDLG
jgi:drug/metabolite transporter (DMT)-like permease